MIIYKQVSQEAELIQILEVQQKNLNTVLEKSEREQEGFVTVSHSLGVLKKMNRACPHIIAFQTTKS